MLALDRAVHGVGVGLELPPPGRHALRPRRFPGGWFLAAALQLGLGLPGHLPCAGGPGRPFLVPGVSGFEAACLRGQRGSQRPGVSCLHLVVFCVGVGRLLPGVGVGLPGQAQLAAHIPRCGRLRAFAFEDLALQLAPAHGPELGLFVGDLQGPDRVPAQGFELGVGMRVQAHRLLRVGDPPRLPVRRGRASPLRVVFPQDRGGVRAGRCPEMPGQPRFGVLQRPLAEFPAPVIEPGGQLVRQRRGVLRCPLRPRHAVSLPWELQALEAAVQDAGDRPGAVHRGGGDPLDDLADVVPGELGLPQLVLQHLPGVLPVVPPSLGSG